MKICIIKCSKILYKLNTINRIGDPRSKREREKELQ